MPRLLFFLLSLLPLTMMAQEDSEEVVRRAGHIFSLIQHDQADSLYDMMADDMRQVVTREHLRGVMLQVEQMFGSFRELSQWEVTRHDSLTVCSTICSFESGSLNLIVAFDDSWLLHGLRLMPVSENTSDEPLPDGVVELVDTVYAADGLALPCVVTLSGLSAEPPIVVMVHGSGPLDRDETVMTNKPFRDLAHLLALRGISSLRYDKRTFVSSDPVASVEEETVNDALAAVALARTYNNNVYVLGHSLGAMMAPDIAASTVLQGIVMMAAPARDMEQVVGDQLDFLAASGATEEQKRQALSDLHRQAPHYFVPQHQVHKALRLSIPMLLLQGERDYQVTMTDFRIWQKKLGKKKQVTLISYPSLNHLFISGEGPATPQEYLKKGIVSEQVADDIAKFISPKNR